MKDPEQLLVDYLKTCALTQRVREATFREISALILLREIEHFQSKNERLVASGKASVKKLLKLHEAFLQTNGRWGVHGNFYGMDLIGVDFRKHDIRKASFNKSILVDADFTGNNLTDCMFIGADLTGAKGFSGKTLEMTDVFDDAWLPKELALSEEYRAYLAKHNEAMEQFRDVANPTERERPLILRKIGNRYKSVPTTFLALNRKAVLGS